jgi:hypothetical protein
MKKPSPTHIPIEQRRFTLNDVPFDLGLLCLGDVADEATMQLIGSLRVGEELMLPDTTYLLKRTR